MYERSCKVPIYLLPNSILPNKLAGAYLYTTYLPRTLNMPWHAKPGCAKYHRAALERIVNALPPSYLLPPSSGELFEGLEDCNRRLRGYALAEGFDIVRHGGGTKTLPSYRFRCIFHGSKTQNHRKLEDYVERDSEGNITSKR